MSKFEIRKINAIKGKQIFYELEIDGVSQFSTFSEGIEKLYESELLRIYGYLNLVANLKRLPKEKFKDITPKKETVKEYEVKSKHLRIYMIHLEHTGKIVLFGGFKNKQKKDISKFRKLKSRFLNQ